MDPIRPVTSRDEAVSAITPLSDSHVRRETPEEAHERRQREARERQRQRARREWAEAQLAGRRAVPEPVIVHEDESDDGHAHVDVRV